MIDSPVEEIKHRLDVVDVIGGYIKLKKSGKDYRALCPFHSEKTPSFFVSPSKQIWHCFGCGAGGDMFSFVSQMEGVEFADALRILAQKAGVTLKRQDPQLKSQRSKLYEICEEAAEFFEENLKKNKAAQDYLKNRGISLESIKEFKIGFALDSWDSLYKHLTELGYKSDDVEKAGLIIPSQKLKIKSQKYYDRFRGRIIFPIRDISGQVIGFTGRIFSAQGGSASGGQEPAKYLNSPETLIFNKSQVLYPLDKAKVEIRKKEQCILVEGQMDVIMSHQADIKNAVATSGTALTPDHLRIIKRYTDNLLLAFDPDTAGQEATKKSIGTAQQLEFNVGVIVLEKGKDPADTIKENPKIWEEAIENAKPIMEFYFENVFSKYNPERVEDKRKIAQELLPAIKKIANQIEQAHWLQVLAARLNVQEKLMAEALTKVKSPADEDGSPSVVPHGGTKEEKGRVVLEKLRIQNLEENLLGFILKYPEHLEHLKNLETEYFTNQITQKVFQHLVGQKSGQPPQPYPPVGETGYLDHIMFQVEHYNLDKKEVIKEINFCIKEIKSNYFKKKLSEISLAIKRAEREGDKKIVKKLTEEFNKLSKEL
jgi:DNA primase